MQLILAILLYLRVIMSPGTYTQGQIDTAVDKNRAQIDAVQNDQKQMDQVRSIYVPQTDNIVIVSQSEED